MKEDSKNTWLAKDSDEGKRQVDFYTSSKDFILVERKRTTKLLFDLVRYHFGIDAVLRVLDIGCGDGSMVLQLRELHPNHQFYLMDGSEDMLSKAKDKLNGDSIFFIKKSFEEYICSEPETSKYDLIYSSNAIHHLTFQGKSQLYLKIYNDLNFDGMFMNIDLVLPPTKRCEEWEFKMWIDWMNETLEKNNLKEDLGKHDNLPNIYKSKAENQPSDLFDQLAALRKCGFKDVDCFYKYGIFAMFGGTK